jgi:outer membrane receptor protein involved in Fe transport
MRFQKTVLPLLVATSGLAFASSAWAQQTAPQAAPQAAGESGRGLEEIVVTARRSSEKLINVPVAVTALSQQMIEKAHVTDLTQVAQMTPNLIIASAGSGTGGSISIRGVGTSFLDPGLEQSVGLNSDGVPIGRGHFLNAAQFDLKQIEVLKGPQALFFGKNSPAGVISISSADPTSTLTAMVRAGYEFHADEKFVEAYIAGPITDTLGYRVAGKFSKLEGWFHNNVPPGPSLTYPGFNTPGALYDRGSAKTLIGRVTLKWQPTTDFTANLKFTANKVTGDSVDSAETKCVAGSPGAATGKLSTLALGQGKYIQDPNSDCNLDYHTSRGQLPTEFLANWPLASKHGGKAWSEVRTYVGALNMQYVRGPLTFTSITGYTNLYAANYSNASQDSYSTVTSTPLERGHTWTQELRLQSAYDGPLNFVFGGFFESAKRLNSYQPILGFIGFDAANGNSAYTFKDHYNNSGKTYSAFGQIKWKIIEELELSGGVRYTHEHKNTLATEDYLNALGVGFGLAPVGSQIHNDVSFSNYSPEITLRYKPANNIMTYVAYKTGYKSGGISTPATISTAYIDTPANPNAHKVLQFSPEKSKGFEAGVKAELFDRTLRLDATVYRYSFSNLQLTSFDAALVAYFIKNAGKARTTGIETSATWQATPELQFTAGASYNDAKFTSFQNAQCYALIQGTPACGPNGYDRTGQPLPRAPKGTFSGGFNYEKPITNRFKVGVGAEGIHTSSYVISETGDPNVNQEPYWMLNANVKLATVDDKWSLELIGRNLTNEYIGVIANDKVFSPAGQVTVYSVRPRQIVLQATAKF